MADLDQDNLLGSIEALPRQIEDAWKFSRQVSIPASYNSPSNIILMGMGGSSLGGLVVKHLLLDKLKIPMEISRDYTPPAYVGENTLTILSSYSGTTEETLAAIKHVESRNSKVLVVSAGGPLGDYAREKKLPYYQIQATHNPSRQPRMAIGYTVFGLLGIFTTLKLLELKDKEVTQLATGLAKTALRLSPESIEGNPAKYLAYSANDRLIILVSSGHLLGATRVFNNQINENAKQMTAEHPLPEFNHHYMEGLTFPRSLQGNTFFLLFQSSLFHPRIQKRVPLTKMVIEKEGHACEVISATAPTPLEQVFEIIQLGSYVSFYMGMLNGVNPGPVPNVDLFKSSLSK